LYGHWLLLNVVVELPCIGRSRCRILGRIAAFIVELVVVVVVVVAVVDVGRIAVELPCIGRSRCRILGRIAAFIVESVVVVVLVVAVVDVGRIGRIGRLQLSDWSNGRSSLSVGLVERVVQSWCR